MLDATEIIAAMLETRILTSETLRDTGEFELIKYIAAKTKKDDASVMIGIGDDAAVLSRNFLGKGKLAVSTDALVEDIHFRRRYPGIPEEESAEDLGWKSLAVNVSDMAAMGATPFYYLLSLSIPASLSSIYMKSFLKGLNGAARRYGLSLIGGDTTSSPDRIFISVTIIGVAGHSVLGRKGAKVGDLILVTGSLGDSALGLKLLESSTMPVIRDSDDEFLIKRHLRPMSRLREGKLLAETGLITSMIDVSDGLLSDLGHICEASGKGAEVRLNNLPLSRPFIRKSPQYGGIELAIAGGEDYELLFTLSRDDLPRLNLAKKRIRYTIIGEIQRRNGIRLLDEYGQMFISKHRGYEHFR